MKLLYTIIIFLSLVACSTSKNVLDSVTLNDFNLSNYKTYSLEVTMENQEGLSFSEAQKLLIHDFSKQLTARGLTEAVTVPELIINLDLLQYKVERGYKTDITLDPVFDNGNRTYNKDDFDLEVDTNNEVTLFVKLMENKANPASWEGIVSKKLPKNEEKNAIAIEEIVNKVFESIDTNNH